MAVGIAPHFITPHEGVRIEIEENPEGIAFGMVTPHEGVWIEIVSAPQCPRSDEGHSPCGSAD